MAHKILGKVINNGEYNGKEYTNLVLYTQDLDTPNNDTFDGIKTAVIKIRKNPVEIYNEIVVNDVVEFYYDKYGNVVSFRS